MPIGFLVPAFLAGLAAIVVPLLLHLRHRERQKPRPFPSLMFLGRIPIRTDQKRRITDWPLLLLRLLALGLLVAAFARPFLREPPRAAAGDAGLTVLLLDRSASMAAAGTNEAWADSARAVLDRLPAGRRVAVAAFDAGAAILVQPTSEPAAARAAIASAPEPAGATRYSAGLRAAAQLLAAEPLPGEIVLVTDLQQTGLAAASAPALPAGTQLVTVAVPPTSRDNAAVVSLEVEPVPGGAARRAVVAARLAHYGGTATRDVEATLEVDGRVASTARVRLPATGTVRVTFDTVALSRAEVRVRVALTPDGLPSDDAYHAVVPAEVTTRVALVTTPDARPDEYRYLQQALGIGRDPAFEVERITRLDQSVIARSRAIVLMDVAPPGGAVGTALAEWVAAGGGLVLVPGERMAERRAALEVVPAELRGSRQRSSGAVLGRPLNSHPALAAFQGQDDYGFGALRIRRHNLVEPVEGASVLLRYDDGAPAIIAGTRGSGRTAVVAIPLDGRRGDFPLQPAFLPFARGLVGWAAAARAGALALASGEAWLAPAELRSPLVRAPSGEVLRPATGSRFVTLRESGMHEVHDGRSGGMPTAVLAVNAPPGESDLTPLDAGELLLGAGELPPAVALTGSEIRVASEARQQGWRWVLLALLGILLVEVVVASRGWRGISAQGPVGATPQERGS